MRPAMASPRDRTWLGGGGGGEGGTGSNIDPHLLQLASSSSTPPHHHQQLNDDDKTPPPYFAALPALANISPVHIPPARQPTATSFLAPAVGKILTCEQLEHVRSLVSPNGDGASHNASVMRDMILRLVDHVDASSNAHSEDRVTSDQRLSTLFDRYSSLALTCQAAVDEVARKNAEMELLRRQADLLARRRPSSAPSTPLHMTPKAQRWRQETVTSPYKDGSQRSRLNSASADRNATSGSSQLYGDYAPPFAPYLEKAREDTVIEQLEEVNRRLVGDRKALKRRLRNTEAELAHMTQELKRIRTHLLTGGTQIYAVPLRDDEDDEEAQDVDDRQTGHIVDSTIENIQNGTNHAVHESVPTNRKRRRRLPTMGDAEAEHLLLAGKKLSSVTRRIPRPLQQQQSSSLSLYATAVYEPVNGAKQTGALPSHSAQDMAGQDANSLSQKQNPTSDLPHSPKTAVSRKNTSLKRPRHPSALSLAETDGGVVSSDDENVYDPVVGSPQRGNNMDDLLAAAQTVLTRSSSPLSSKVNRKQTVEEPLSMKRRRETSAGPSDSTSRNHLLSPPSHGVTLRGDASTSSVDSAATHVDVMTIDHYPSALDVLADQAFATQGRHSDARSRLKTPTSPVQVDYRISPSPPRQRRRIEVTPPPVAVFQDTFNSTSRATTVMVKKSSMTIPLTSSYHDESPELTPAAAAAKKSRSPYIKWNMQEDEMLVKAVSEHGQRWDAVSKCVPSRSYHQCRQRWLRGLKSGENLPDDLQIYYPAIKIALRAHEAQKRETQIVTGRLVPPSDYEDDLLSID